MVDKNKVVWLNNADGLFLTYVGYCPSEKAWNSEMKKLKIKDSNYSTSAGNCTHFNYTKDNKKIILVTINPQKKQNKIEVLGIMVHEIVHVVQFLMEGWGEEKPSEELQAYTTQYFFQQLYEAYYK